MKLLSDTQGRMKLISALVKHENKISVPCYILGLVWMTLLCHEEFSAKNYFSENQLLPGLVDSYFSEHRYAIKVYNSLQSICEDKNSISNLVKEELHGFGLDVYQQSFYMKTARLNGTNTYGIYRSPRASGVESIVINVPLHDKCRSNGATALMLAIAKYFSSQSFWAKDIIFVLTEHEVHGMKAWLSSYFTDHSEDIHAEELYAHGGSIQAAIVFDFEMDHISHFDVLIEGLNGQLPNLDVINLVYRISRYEGVPVKFNHQDFLHQTNADFLANIQTVYRMMVQQASGYPTGNHGMFFKYRIEAVTLKGRNDRNINNQKIHFEQIGRFAEAIFRSINNMLEHFHQSFFLYVLPNTQRYISIGMYMPPIGCLVVPLVVKLFVLWIKIFQLDRDEKEVISSESLSVLFQYEVARVIIVSIVMSWTLVYVLHYLLFNLKDVYINERIDNVILTVILLVMVVAITRLFSLSDQVIRNVLNLYIVLHLSLLLVVTSIINFSMAFFIAMVAVPLVIIQCRDTVNTRSFFKIFNLMICFLLNPLTVICAIILVSKTSLIKFNITTDIQNNFYTSIKEYLNYTTQYTLNNTDYVIRYGILPLWLLLTVNI